jgi:hypothetical protein
MHPPAEKLGAATGEERERLRRGCVRRKWSSCGAVEDTTERRPQYVIARTTIGRVVHEQMDHGDDGKSRTCRGVGDWGPTTIGVPAKDARVGREAYRPQSIRARRELHAARRHMEDVGPARCIQLVRPMEEARERQSGYALPPSAHPRRHPHPDCRSPLTLIVALRLVLLLAPQQRRRRPGCDVGVVGG